VIDDGCIDGWMDGRTDGCKGRGMGRSVEAAAVGVSVGVWASRSVCELAAHKRAGVVSEMSCSTGRLHVFDAREDCTGRLIQFTD
jgi:hypothetical protein